MNFDVFFDTMGHLIMFLLFLVHAMDIECTWIFLEKS